MKAVKKIHFLAVHELTHPCTDHSVGKGEVISMKGARHALIENIVIIGIVKLKIRGGNYMFSKKKLEVWIGGIVLGAIVVGSIYLLIPKNLGRLLEKDANYYISINEMYYSQEENIIKPSAYSIDITDEAYTDFIDLLGEYNYHGFWQSLWGKTAPNPDVYYIINDGGKGFVIDSRGKFYLKRNDRLYTYYLGWFGHDQESQLYAQIKQALDKE